MTNKKSIGYLGPGGTFTEQAANALFKSDKSLDFKIYDTIQKCLLAAKNKETNYTVVPIENSIGGSVNITLDWLIHEISVPIQGEIYLPISYELLVNEKQRNAASYKIIYGHPQALMQCDKYLRKYYKNVELQPTESSAIAAELVAKKPDHSGLALANVLAKGIYGLTAIDQKIENNAENKTRFIVLGYEKIDLPSENIKSTIVVSFPENDLTVLRKVLEVLEQLEIKPIKIESTPMKTELGEYVFIIDLETTNKSETYQQACVEIRALNCNLRHLGSYPSIVKKQERLAAN